MSTMRVAIVEIVIDVKYRIVNLVVLKYVAGIVVGGKRSRLYESIADFGSGVSCSMTVRTSLVCCIVNGCQWPMA